MGASSKLQSQAMSIMEKVVTTCDGDLGKLSPSDRGIYYKAVCESVGLNPLTRPFAYIRLNGKLVLYALREATEQLRRNHGVSIVISDRANIDGTFVVTARATDRNNRTDESIGAVEIANAKGEDKANAMMKAETKAKRRVTLSLVGLSMPDESEIESIRGAEHVRADPLVDIDSSCWSDEIREAAEKAAAGGTVSYQSWWKEQPREFKLAASATSEHESFKDKAAEADKALAAELASAAQAMKQAAPEGEVTVTTTVVTKDGAVVTDKMEV